MPHFHEFDTDTSETSHTVFTPFTRHQIERFLRYIWCLNKTGHRKDMLKVKRSVWKKISL